MKIWDYKDVSKKKSVDVEQLVRKRVFKENRW